MAKNGPTNEAPLNGVPRATKEQRAEALRLYLNTDLTAETIGKRVGVSRQTVHRWTAAADVPPRGQVSRPRQEEEQEAATPVGGLLGRVMDEMDEVRRELAAHNAYMKTQTEATVRLLEALTAAVNRMEGAHAAHDRLVLEALRPQNYPPQQ